jgi:hypothetical protein
LGVLAGTRKLLTPTTLALSAAMGFDDPDVRRFGRHLRDILVLGTQRRAAWQGPLGMGARLPSTTRLFEEQGFPAYAPDHDEPKSETPDRRELALALLRFADLGIDDVHVVEEGDGGVILTKSSPEPGRKLRLMHRVAGQEVPFELAEESEGTRTWFRLIGPALSALRDGQILLFDEIDASLHPKLSARLLELFQDAETNPLGAQLIFTTHDTSLLNHLNRDEVWLTEKGDNGATTLTALAEYGGDKVRRSLNLEKAYLQGRFGAVPELDQFTLRQALGLASGGS